VSFNQNVGMTGNNMGGNWGSNNAKNSPNMGGGIFQPPIPFNTANLSRNVFNYFKKPSQVARNLQEIQERHFKRLKQIIPWLYKVCKHWIH